MFDPHLACGCVGSKNALECVEMSHIQRFPDEEWFVIGVLTWLPNVSGTRINNTLLMQWHGEFVKTKQNKTKQVLTSHEKKKNKENN